MDYRLPGLDGVQATAGRARGVPRRRRRLPDGVGERARDRGALRGGRGRLPDEGPGARRHRRRDQARVASQRPTREPHGRQHGDRPRLDRRLPRRRGALPELARRAAVRELRHGQLPRRRRPDGGRSSTSACARHRAADDVPADAARLPRLLRRARRLRADPLAAPRGEPVGHVPERRASPRPSSATGACARSTPRRRLPGSRCLRSRSSGGSSAVRPTRRWTRSSRVTRTSTGCSSPSTRSSSSRAAGASAARRRSRASCCT